MARDLERYVWCVETQRKAKVCYQKAEARQSQKVACYLLHWSWWWRIYGDHENARRKLEVPMPAAMSCKTSLCRRSRWTCCVGKNCKTKYACVVETDESTRKRMEGSLHKYHVAGKGLNSLRHYNLVRKFIPMLQATAAVDKEWKNRESTGTAGDERQKHERCDQWSKEEGQQWSFCVIDGSLSSQEFGVWASISKIQRRSCTPRWHCKRWFWFVCTVHWERIISIPNDSRKSHGHYIQTSWMFRSSSRRSISLHPGQNGRWFQIAQNSKVRVSWCMDSVSCSSCSFCCCNYVFRSDFGIDPSGPVDYPWNRDSGGIPKSECSDILDTST